MPIDYYIDHARLLVVARGKGVVTDSDVFAYQHAVWSQPEVTGYDELVDMTAVELIETPVPEGPRLQQLASEAAAMDHPASAVKLAIVAPASLAFGLARAYQSHRELDARSRKQVEVFRTLAEALAFLGIETLESPEPEKD